MSLNQVLQLVIHVCNLIIVVNYAVFAFMAYRAFRLSDKEEHQQVFFHMSLVFLLCATTGYLMHVINWWANFELYIRHVNEKDIVILLINSGFHIALSVTSYLLVKSAAMARLINTINDLKDERFLEFKKGGGHGEL